MTRPNPDQSIRPKAQRNAARAAGKAARAKAATRRPVGNPVTSDRQYSDEERAFLTACERYQSQYSRRFLLATEYLHIVKAMGYRRSS